MFELICALAIGLILGFSLKKEQQPPLTTILENQVEHLEKELDYYKKLCQTLADENSEFRRKQ
jgi:hypothetical protein